MIIAFAGHSYVSSADKVKEKVKEQIRNIYTDYEHITCYIGGYGAFDDISAHACKELKKEGLIDEVAYVTPYISLSWQTKIKEMQSYGLCDFSIYPPIENVPLRFAISKRNEWVMTNADLIIAYVKHAYGGAYKSLQIAKRRKKRIINIGELI